MNKSITSVLLASVAFVVGCLLVGQSLEKFRSRNAKVSVKGIAERVVKSDYAIWRIKFDTHDTKFTKARQQYQHNVAVIEKFLMECGFTNKEWSVKTPDVHFTNEKSKTNNGAITKERYTIQGEFMVNSADVDRVEKSASNTIKLLEQGVILTKEYGSNPRYLLRNFDNLRPMLLQESIQSANNMARKFAEHSGAIVGKIRYANQGNFHIYDPFSGYDQEASIMKKIKVISHVDFALE